MSSGSSVTSAFHDPRVQGSSSVEPTQAMSFQMAHTHAAPTSGGLRAQAGVDQNLFDEPFMLDVNFDQLAFDELLNASDRAFSPHFFPKDPAGVRCLSLFFFSSDMLMGMFPTVYVTFICMFARHHTFPFLISLHPS